MVVEKIIEVIGNNFKSITKEVKEVNPIISMFLGIMLMIVGLLLTIKYSSGIFLMIIGVFVLIIGLGRYCSENNILKYLHTLSYDEFFILKNCFSQKRSTMSFNVTDNNWLIASNLQDKGILLGIKDKNKVSEEVIKQEKKMFDDFTRPDAYVSFIIPNFVYSYVKKNNKKLYYYLDEEKMNKIYLFEN